MTNALLHFGTENASKVPNPSESGALELTSGATVANLLKVLKTTPTRGLKMLESTCSVLCMNLNEDPDHLTIQAILDAKDDLRLLLSNRKYAENSIRTYVNNVTILLNRAREAGWRPSDAVPEAWWPVMAKASEKKRRQLIKAVAKTGQSPRDVSEQDVCDWADKAVSRGASLNHANQVKTWFWKALHDLNLTGPKGKRLMTRYMIGPDFFPDPLKKEVNDVLKWKQAPFAAKRPKNGRHRPVTARNLRYVLCGLYGFAVNILGNSEITSLQELVREDIVTSYVEWAINERQVKGLALRTNLCMLRAALRYHPVHRMINLDWFDPLLSSIPIESKSERKKRKAYKYLEYSVLEQIPNLIRLERAKTRKSMLVSRLAMRELLMKWLITLPWRQLNIRECRVSGPEPNLFKGPIPPFSDLTKPDWVVEEETMNPNAVFWQFQFNVHETKTGIDVHALLPKQLVPILEEYINEHRPRLLRGKNSETLFLNRAGRPLRCATITELIEELTLRYGGKKVNPHSFRDIVAYTWLLHHSEDYLTLSKMLWHSNLATTVETYGSRFNESAGAVAMESWLDTRQAESR